MVSQRSLTPPGNLLAALMRSATSSTDHSFEAVFEDGAALVEFDVEVLASVATFAERSTVSMRGASRFSTAVVLVLDLLCCTMIIDFH